MSSGDRPWFFFFLFVPILVHCTYTPLGCRCTATSTAAAAEGDSSVPGRSEEEAADAIGAVLVGVAAGPGGVGAATASRRDWHLS